MHMILIVEGLCVHLRCRNAHRLQQQSPIARFQLREKGDVYVNFNTRESPLAPPNSGELSGVQNYGILDVDMAMKWVRIITAHKCIVNIPLRLEIKVRANEKVDFGGNPNDMVFGGQYLGRANALSGPAFAPAN